MGKGGCSDIWGVTGTSEGQACLFQKLRIRPQWIQEPPAWSSPPLALHIEVRSRDSLLSQLKQPSKDRSQKHQATLCPDSSLPQRKQQLYFWRRVTRSWRPLSPVFPQSSWDPHSQQHGQQEEGVALQPPTRSAVQGPEGSPRNVLGNRIRGPFP